jgi:hypothetical protein
MCSTSTNCVLFKLSENHSVLLGLFHLNRAMLVELYVDELITTISFGTPSLYLVKRGVHSDWYMNVLKTPDSFIGYMFTVPLMTYFNYIGGLHCQ